MSDHARGQPDLEARRAAVEAWRRQGPADRAVAERAFRDKMARRFSFDPGHPDAVVDEVRLEGEYPDTCLVVIFRAEGRRPGCVFGWRWGPIWEHPDMQHDVVVWANFDETVCEAPHRLPRECPPGEVVWVP